MITMKLWTVSLLWYLMNNLIKSSSKEESKVKINFSFSRRLPSKHSINTIGSRHLKRVTRPSTLKVFSDMETSILTMKLSSSDFNRLIIIPSKTLQLLSTTWVEKLLMFRVPPWRREKDLSNGRRTEDGIKDGIYNHTTEINTSLKVFSMDTVAILPAKAEIMEPRLFNGNKLEEQTNNGESNPMEMDYSKSNLFMKVHFIWPSKSTVWTMEDNLKFALKKTQACIGESKDINRDFIHQIIIISRINIYIISLF